MNLSNLTLPVALVLILAVGPVPAADWDSEDEQWYDPADWFDTDAGVDYEYDVGDSFYYDYLPDDEYAVGADRSWDGPGDRGPDYGEFDTLDDLWDTEGYWDLDYDDYYDGFYESDLREDFANEALYRPFNDDDSADYTYFDEYDDYDFGQEYPDVTRDRPSPYRQADYGVRDDARVNEDFESDVPNLPPGVDEDAADYTYFDEYDDYDFGQEYEEVIEDYPYEQ